MNTLTDQELLRDYAACRSESAFAELVRRHVDFVYSAALRMVHDAHTADDVTQGVFMALAENAGKLTDRTILAGWLHRTTQFLASKAIRSEVRRRTREQEAAAMIELSSAEPDVIWEQIAPTLDTVLDELDEADRDVLFLRYFQHKSAREISETLGINEEAAKKRVSRAVDRLRELFAKRGITVGAAGIIVAISANAVQAAPIGLTAAIATAAALAGTTIVTTHAIAMTTLQKAAIGTLLTTAIVLALFEARVASDLRNERLNLNQQQAQLTAQLQQLQREGELATNQLALLTEEVEKNKGAVSELLRLRNQVGMLQREKRQSERDRIRAEKEKNAPPFQLRAVLEKPEVNTEPMEEEDKNGAVRTIYVVKQPLLDQSVIASATLAKGLVGEPEIEIVLTPAGKELFTKISQENTGKQLAFVAYGHLYSAPVIAGQIPSGILLVHGFHTEDEARALAARINAAIQGQ